MYIHVIIVAPEKILTPADIPWRREWRHSANSTPLQKAGEPENDAGYPKHVASKTAVIHIYLVVTVFRLH